MNLRFTPQAHADLLEIRRYISAELHNETAAQRIARAILSSCSNLKCFPQMGIALSEKINVQTAIRYIVSEKHLIFYTVDEGYISIMRFWTAEQTICKSFSDTTLFSEDRRESFPPISLS